MVTNMFDIPVSPEQIAYATSMVEQYNFGQRGRGDGNQREQRTGIIGQTVFADLIGYPRPDGATGFDGGKDFVIHGKKADIKTMTRKCAMRNYFVHNFIGYQKDYDVDYYIFASFNTTNSVLSICGYVDKKTFFERAQFFDIGSTRTRSDGTSFQLTAPNYEIQQQDLFSVSTLEDLIQCIK